MSRVLVLAGLLMLSGCYTSKIHYGGVNPARTSSHMRIQHTFFWGLVSPGSTNLTRVCDGNQVVSVKTQLAGFALIGYYLTGGIYTPMTVTVTCAKG